MPDHLNRRTVLAGSIALLSGCSVLDSGSGDAEPDRSPKTTLDSIVLRNRYSGDDVPEEEETASSRNTTIALLVELDGEVVGWSEHELSPRDEYILNDKWPSEAGAWTVHAREVVPTKAGVHSEWPSINLEDVVQSDETTPVAVDVIVKETGRIALDATPTS
ncbi:hypothetical protein ACKVMT_04295 [Halobacteriales archaeon Cl-PHB]